jgi:hypothetical protein
MPRTKLDHDAKLFLMFGNAMMDAKHRGLVVTSIKYDFCGGRSLPADTCIRNQTVTSWAWPLTLTSRATGNLRPGPLGQNWRPYQALGVVTPAFPEYVSGHFRPSNPQGGATLLALFNGSDTFGGQRQK